MDGEMCVQCGEDTTVDDNALCAYCEEIVHETCLAVHEETDCEGIE